MVTGDRGDPQKNFERMVALARGPKGERGAQGNQGNRGERGTLSRIQGRAVVVLFLICAIAAVSSWFWIAHEVTSTAAAQRRAGQIVERKICTTLAALAVLKPPAGDPAANPSRAYDQELHATLDQLGPDLGCH